MATQLPRARRAARGRRRPCAARVRRAYTVLLETADGPAAFIELHLRVGYVGVFFLDDEMREHTEHVFPRPPDLPEDGEGLLLTRAVHRTFDEHGNLITAVQMRFRADGHIDIVKANLQARTKETATSKIDPDRLWEPIPEFGNYLSLARFER